MDVTNSITAGNNQPLTLYTTLAPPLLPNRSPVFSDTAVAIVCQNDTTITLNNAVDPDGDRLVYSFGAPYGAFADIGQQLSVHLSAAARGRGLLPRLLGGAAVWDGRGQLCHSSTPPRAWPAYGARTQGKYVVAVDVREYRTINGREVLIGTTRRDLQLIVAQCPSTRPPVLPSAAVTPRSYTIEAGQTLSYPHYGHPARRPPAGADPQQRATRRAGRLQRHFQ
ncbi:MAG: hypothetical protein WKG07_05260 [Hymenobacter sp.]